MHLKNSITAVVKTLGVTAKVLVGGLVAVTFISVPRANAYFSTIDNGDLVRPGAYQASFEPQLIFNKYDGANFVGRLDTGIDDQSSFRAILGVGKVDFQIGGMYKIVPFPDTPNQPAIGADMGILIAKVNGETETSLRFHPMTSKKFETEVGDFQPYVALPFGVTWRSGNETFVPVQIAGGTEFRSLNLPNLSYFAELGINLNRSFSYLSVAIAYRFDDSMVHRK